MHVFARGVQIVAFLITMLVVPPALSHTTYTGALVATDCTWESNAGNWFNITIHLADRLTPRPTTTLIPRDWPGAVTHEGRVYDFRARMEAARQELNLVLPSTGSGIQLSKGSDPWRGNINDPALTNVIAVFYHDRNDADIGTLVPNEFVATIGARAGGDTTCQNDNGTRRTDSRILRGYVRVNEYQHWHTAQVRTDWENCLTRTNPAVSYLCSKDHDLQSSYSHELVHLLGHTRHPEDVSNAAVADAHCVTPTRTVVGGVPSTRVTDPAMICPAGVNTNYRFTTARRTLAHLHDYDRLGLFRQMRDQL